MPTARSIESMRNKNRAYWARRSEAVLVAQEKKGEEQLALISNAYEKAKSAIDTEVAKFYKKYADENGLVSIEEARSHLSIREREAYRSRLARYFREAKRHGGDPAYERKLKEMSAKLYVERMDVLKTNIEKEVHNVVQYSHEGIRRTLADVYEDTSYRTSYNMYSDLGGFKVGFSLLRPSQEQIIKAVSERWLGANYSDRVWSNKVLLVREINEIIPESFARGVNSSKLSQALADRMNVSRSSAARLLRTEINHIEGEATATSYERGGVEKYEYIATLDSRTSEVCSETDGKVFELSKREVGLNYPPLHPYCRSTTIPHFDDNEIVDRIMRNKEGKSIYAGKNMGFEEWATKYASPSYVRRLGKNSVSSPTKRDLTPSQQIATLKHFDKQMNDYDKKVKQSGDLTAQQITELEEAFTKMVENSDFAIRVPSEVLDSVLHTGYKTQFETGETGGTYSPQKRKEVSNIMFGTDIDAAPNSAYEKYGYLAAKDKTSLGTNSPGLRQYGDVQITLKREAVFDRTTFTMEDSLGAGLNYRIMPSYVSNPKYHSLKRTMFDANVVPDIVGGLKDANYSPEAFAAVERPFLRYVEAQYHGDITIEHIEDITIRIGGPKDVMDGFQKEAAKAALQHGLKVNLIESRPSPHGGAYHTLIENISESDIT